MIFFFLLLFCPNERLFLHLLVVVVGKARTEDCIKLRSGNESTILLARLVFGCCCCSFFLLKAIVVVADGIGEVWRGRWPENKFKEIERKIKTIFTVYQSSQTPRNIKPPLSSYFKNVKQQFYSNSRKITWRVTGDSFFKEKNGTWIWMAL